jgi:drug/metabolite transporter (DMT)-like permease
MKVNFWQVLGIVLVVVGVIFYARSKMGTGDTVTPNGEPAVSQPAP